MAEISIRTTIRPGDIGAVTEAHGRIYSCEYGYSERFEAYVAEGLAEFIFHYDPSRSHMWICEDGSTIVGAMVVVDRGSSAQLRYYYVEPGYRGKGLGKELMSRALEFIRDAGYTSAFLWTTSELTDAAALYGKFGFLLSEEKPSMSFGKSVIEQKYTLLL
jgi:peptidyl-dipeptidase Dcp